MRFRSAATLLAFVLASALGGTARADEAQDFVQHEQAKLTALLHQPPSPARDAALTKQLGVMVDYDELARRAFGQPCPVTVPGCTNDWAKLTEPQQKTLTDLLKQLVVKNYEKNLEKSLDYEITYKGVKDVSGDTRIRTEAKSKSKPRDPAVQVDYIVHADNGHFHVVDIVTEGSSLTKNYYDQFDKKMKAKTTPAEGYEDIAAKLREKIARP